MSDTDFRAARERLDRAGPRDRPVAFQSGDRHARSGSSGRSSSTFDPLKDVQGFDDLKKFRAVRGRVAARRSGAALGAEGAMPSKPILRLRNRRNDRHAEDRAINVDDFRIDYELFSETLPDDKFPEGRELADARAVADRDGCGWRSSIWRSIAAASASASISIRAG